MKHLILLAILNFCCLRISASVDTLRHWVSGGGTASYSNYDLQVARFEPPAPGDVLQIIVGLGGSAGTATIHLFGHEGGTSFPQLESDLINPVVVTKNSGDTMIAISLSTPVFLDNNNFFIAVSDLGSGVTFLSDNITHTAFCSSGSGGNYWYQFMKDSTGQWFLGQEAFLVDIIMDVPVDTTQQLFMDVTTAAGIDTTHSNQTMAWGDFNEDGHLDLLIGGILYQNTGAGNFQNVTAAKNIWGNPRVSAFIDMDNDEDLDLLFIGLSDSGDQAALFLNDSAGNFTGNILTGFAFPKFKAPHSLSIGDYNMDDYPDVFVSQLWDVYPNALPNYLLRNNQNNGLINYTASDMFQSSSTPNRRSRGSQWTDFDDDGDMDLYVSNYYLEKDELWQNDGNNELVNIATPKQIDVNNTGASHGTGVDWMDYDNDGDLDILSPQFAHPGFMLQYDHRGTTIYDNSGPPDYDFTDKVGQHGIQYEETHGGGAWGDLNNDGLVDLVMTTYYGCRYMEVYEQQADHSFVLETFKYGVQNIVTGQDVAYADYDNDGLLDMAGGENDQARIYRNASAGSNNWIQLDLLSCTGNSQAIGARVWVYSGSDKYMQEVTAGRGQRMQKPSRLHFGLGSNSMVDSVVIRWPNGVFNSETVTGLSINQRHVIDETDCVLSRNGNKSGQMEIRVWPNPFESEAIFHGSGAGTGLSHLVITNPEGKTVYESYAESQGGFLEFRWQDPAASGIFFWKIVTPSGNEFGKIVRQ